MKFKKLILLFLIPLVLLHTNGMVVHIHQCVKHICEQTCCDSKLVQKDACCKMSNDGEEDGCCKNEKKYVKADHAQIIQAEKKLSAEKQLVSPLLVTSYLINPLQVIESSFVSINHKSYHAPPPYPSEYRSVIQTWNC